MAARMVVDTCIAVHWLNPSAPDGEEQEFQNARSLRKLDGWEFMIPAPVLGELLARYSEPEAEAVLRVLEGVEFVPYDRQAAMIAAAIYTGRKTPGVGRQCQKVDDQIVACAVRWGADAICTENTNHFSGPLRRAGGTGVIRLKTAAEFLADASAQPDMFPGE